MGERDVRLGTCCMLLHVGCSARHPGPARLHHSYGRKLSGTEKPLDESKEESEKAGLKLNIPKTKILASGCSTSWQIDGETMETVTDFILLGSKITVDDD